MESNGNEYYESLFLRMLGEGIPPDEYGELERWFEASDANREALVDLYRAHYAVLAADCAERTDPVCALRRLNDSIRAGRMRKLRRIAAGIAASAAILAGIFFLARVPAADDSRQALALDDSGISDVTIVLPDNRTLTFDGKEPEIEHGVGGFVIPEDTLQTAEDKETAVQLIVPKGKRSRLTLPDGTVMWVNADSRIAFPARFGAKREIDVDGEVYLKVAHDAARPFTVHAKNFDVTVLGTSFNVNAYDRNDVQNVTLSEGSVEVAAADNSVTTLSPSQMLTCSSDGVTVSEVDAADQISWITGVYSFKSERLRDIADRMENYYGMPIVFATDRLAEKRFSGRLEFRESADFVYESLAIAVSLEYVVREGRIEFREAER